MNSGRLGSFRQLVHKDFVYLSLYRARGASARDGKAGTHRREFMGSVFLQDPLWLLMKTFARIPAIFEKRPQFCPILVRTRRMNP
jgi:hypothetical protein